MRTRAGSLPTSLGGLTTQLALNVVRPEGKSPGLPRIRLHETRHTAASLMLAAGVSTKVVSEMLGDASPAITLSSYAHVLPGMAEEAGAAPSAVLLGWVFCIRLASCRVLAS
ncbi:MAG: tyrosine-type recombinase/integrase [Acidimicrobiales bacterium]